MSKKVIIDLSKFRDCSGEHSCDEPQPAGVIYQFPGTDGLRTIRELAVFHYTCRRCEDAPCIAVCPCDALEKDENGLVTRAINLCIACKSCVTICPFGTMMTDFFTFKRRWDEYLDMEDEKDLEKFIAQCPDGAVEVTEQDVKPDDNIFQLYKHIYIKEVPWEALKAEE